MKKFASKIVSRLYYLVTGVRANYVREQYADMSGAVAGLATLANALGKNTPRLSWQDAFGSEGEDKDCQDMSALFAKYGSDKSTCHNYHLAYASILKGKRNQSIRIFEMGLGTNDPSAPSSMGAEGKPGASLRAFKEWNALAEVYGADIDRNILFEEERIRTFYADQTDPKTLDELARKLPKDFDLVIDDGLHTPRANINTIVFGLNLLKKGGTLVVEDIYEQDLPIWQTICAVLSHSYECQLVQMTEIKGAIKDPITVCVIRAR